jgi:HEPN domain-containing protein
MKSPLDHARELVEKAGNDLISAQLLAESGQVFDTSCFHAQQTVEKCLKAVLAQHDVTYPRTHDLLVLCDLVEPLLPSLQSHREMIVSLMPYAVAIRYSGFEPLVEDVEAAIAIAAEVYELVDNVINPT